MFWHKKFFEIILIHDQFEFGTPDPKAFGCYIWGIFDAH